MVAIVSRGFRTTSGRAKELPVTDQLVSEVPAEYSSLKERCQRSHLRKTPLGSESMLDINAASHPAMSSSLTRYHCTGTSSSCPRVTAQWHLVYSAVSSEQVHPRKNRTASDCHLHDCYIWLICLHSVCRLDPSIVLFSLIVHFCHFTKGKEIDVVLTVVCLLVCALSILDW